MEKKVYDVMERAPDGSLSVVSTEVAKSHREALRLFAIGRHGVKVRPSGRIAWRVNRKQHYAYYTIMRLPEGAVELPPRAIAYTGAPGQYPGIFCPDCLSPANRDVGIVALTAINDVRCLGCNCLIVRGTNKGGA